MTFNRLSPSLTHGLDLVFETEVPSFAVEDVSGEVILKVSVSRPNSGEAHFENPQKLAIVFFRYEKFLNSLPADFQEGKGRCELLVNDKSTKYFLLGELKNRKRKQRAAAMRKAKTQMLSVIEQLIRVPSIKAHISTFPRKRCCVFNSWMTKTPVQGHETQRKINVPDTVRRSQNPTPNPKQLSVPEMEKFGFSFWEYSGTRPLKFTEKHWSL